ncbi:MAG: copper-binding protein [Deltaproteobacteria bacterium]|nr:copper-binding protein [Deltaproteobacteria bacterium]
MLRVVIVLALALGCGSKPELLAADLAAERFTVRGKVTAIDGTRLDISHEYMPKIRTIDGTIEDMIPMTMGFAATTSAPAAGIAIGDAVKIEFTIHYGTSAPLRLISIEKLPAGTKLELSK